MKREMIVGAAVLLLLGACKKETTEVTNVSEADTTVVVGQDAPPPPPAEIEKKADGTAVKIGEEGVQVDDQSGTKKTNVEINKDGVGIEVKR